MDQQRIIEYMLNNVLATVIFFICLLSLILIFSLMQTDVEERKYEFAVLRTLGMPNKSLITLITIQTLIFALPAIVAGFGLMRVLVAASQVALNELAQIPITIVMLNRTYALGLFTGLLIPFLSTISPIKSALSSTLRSGLDKFRPSIDDVEVEMVRFEN
jgi:ABC-type antimicrobial peptide transport system permease subunit